MKFRSMTSRTALILALLPLGVTTPARADYVFDVAVNTSSLLDSNSNPLNGSQGYLDLQFNPSGGSGVLSATVQALGSNDTTLGTILSFQGSVTGPGNSAPVSGLPLTFVADNTNGPQTNEAFLSVTYGTKLALSLDITPADASSTASFFLTLFDSNGIPVSPNSSGTTPAAVELDLVPNPSGSIPSVSPALLGPGTDVEPQGVVAPEPSSVVLSWGALVCLAGYGLARRRRLVIAA